jgi:5-formyltetrahydrofolate cyclo-ligase
MEKKELRDIVRANKSKVSELEKQREARLVFSTIESLRAYKYSNNILLYYSLPDELPTHEAIERWSKSKKIYLPRVNGDDLEILPYDGNLNDGSYNIKEPAGNDVADANDIDLIIVPAIAVDKHCDRLGRGKGFYDRLLQKMRAYKIGVALDCQFFDEIPIEENDVRLDGIITASHISFRKSFNIAK